jgi:uncharacterized protein (TIRG00374 family)
MTEDPRTTPRPHVGRQALIWTLKIAVSGGLLYLLLSRVDLARLWSIGSTASAGWLAAAIGLYGVVVLVSAWRWGLLLDAQHVPMRFSALTSSFLVATFFNNFLPSNIGGDVVRIRDTSRAAGSKTLATTVVLVDRGIGLLGLVLVAALGTTLTARASDAIGPVGPGILWVALASALALATPAVMRPDAVARALRPLQALHQDWVEVRIGRLTQALARFRAAPQALVTCFVGAVVVQAVLVTFYVATARGLGVAVPAAHLAVIVPISFVVQMLPVSVNGFGVREATFALYFREIGLPLEQAIALSFMGAILMMAFSTSGAVVYAARGSRQR